MAGDIRFFYETPWIFLDVSEISEVLKLNIRYHLRWVFGADEFLVVETSKEDSSEKTIHTPSSWMRFSDLV